MCIFALVKITNIMSVKSTKILVPIGFSEQSIIALNQACIFAKLDKDKSDSLSKKEFGILILAVMKKAPSSSMLIPCLSAQVRSL